MKTGDRVRKRGFTHEGVITGISQLDPRWIAVKWENVDAIPKRQKALWNMMNELEVVK